ncbi:MAG: threonylcarbamoyl-AMP synthase [Firmicutes bacterium]|nr:threonylcarbamoyl-AMP synthase [Bacillota bacterium]
MDFETKLLTESDIDVAAELIRRGECVAFPTETVYGLGANALDAAAVAKIYAAKGRPSDNPLIVHIHDVRQLQDLVSELPGAVERLTAVFWPGPLTLVLPKTPAVPVSVTGGLDTVAVRMPDHPLALAFLRAANLPVAAPSANISGKPSPTRASHVWHDLAGRIPAIIDGGETGWGVESTVLDCTCQPFRVLRPGAVTVEQLQAYVAVELDPDLEVQAPERPRSPGLKYKHYSPEAQVVLVTGSRVQERIQEELRRQQQAGVKTAVMAFTETQAEYGDVPILDLGSKQNLQQAASRIYHLLRKADHQGFELVFVEGVEDEDLGRTIMNRLAKAAGPNVIRT